MQTQKREPGTCRKKERNDSGMWRQGKKKIIADLTERDKCAQRKKWRERKRETKARQKAMEKARVAIPSPPDTPNTPDASTGPSPAEYSRFEFLYRVIC